MGFNDRKAAQIDNNKCIACGACVYQCPFGAIMDKSYMLNVIDYIKPNPFPSFIAKVSLSYNISLFGYSGKSN